jgi:hypothetical protein
LTSSTPLSLKIQGTQLGVGPLLTIPAATSDELGTGKWQGGLPAIAMYPSSQGLLGGLVQLQASFAGESDRPDTNSLTVQPFGLYLPDGRYLRSTAVWTFDLKNDRYYTPVGFGAGKIWKAGATMDRRTVTAVRSSRSVHGWDIGRAAAVGFRPAWRALSVGSTTSSSRLRCC